MVSAWSNSNNMVLGQLKVNDKSNEITAIPALLETLYLKGSIITIEAMGCQTEIASKIDEKQADYILAVKANQDYLLDDMQEAFMQGEITDTDVQIEAAHGRIEKEPALLLLTLAGFA